MAEEETDQQFYIDTQDGITTIFLNRGDQGNRVSDEAAAQISEILPLISRKSRAVVLRGQGADFCLGRELFGHQGTLPEAYDLRAEIEPIFALYDAFRQCEVPTIALIQGRAKGFGCALAAVADVSIVSENARFSFPEMGHQIMPTMAMSAMADRVALKALMYLIYSTEEITAQQALHYGLVSKVVPENALDSSLESFLKGIKSAPLPAVKAVKEYAHAVQSMDMMNANRMAKNLHATVNSSSKMLKTPKE